MNKALAILLFLALSAGLRAGAEPIQVSSETADAELLRAIERELRDVGEAETLFEARRQAQRGAHTAERFLNSQGYFAPDISYSVEPGPPPIAYVKVEPGHHFTFAEVKVETGDQPLSADAYAAIVQARTLEVGDKALPKSILAEEAGLVAALTTAGYAMASAQERSIIGDREEGTLELTYRLNPGPRIRFGDIIYPEESRTRRSYLDRLAPFSKGEIYSPQKLSTLVRRFNTLRQFSFASAQISETVSEVTPEGDEIRDVIMILQERPRYTLSAGGSFSTSEGAGLTAGIIQRNATRRGDTLEAAITLAELRSSFSIDWRLPNVTGLDRTLILSADLEQEDTDAFEREAITISGVYEVRASRNMTYAFGAASEFTQEEDAFAERNQQILSSSLGVRFDYADDPLDATRGWRVDARAEPGLVIGDRQTQFLSLNGQVSAYQPLNRSEQFILAGRVRSGFVFGTTLTDLPVSRRFFAGGGGSARGFEYQSVGPQDAQGTPTGGLGLLEVSTELRWRREGPLGFVGFLDGASVSGNEGIAFDDMRYSAGLGLRYDTLVGPVRFDVATPLDPRDGDDPVQVYVSIGQAF